MTHCFEPSIFEVEMSFDGVQVTIKFEAWDEEPFSYHSPGYPGDYCVMEIQEKGQPVSKERQMKLERDYRKTIKEQIESFIHNLKNKSEESSVISLTDWVENMI